MVFVILGLLGLAGLLALAVTRHVTWLGYVVFVVAAFPGIGLVGGGITHLLQRCRERKWVEDD